jgi:hypothetical protein
LILVVKQVKQKHHYCIFISVCRAKECVCVCVCVCAILPLSNGVLASSKRNCTTQILGN